jgi:hypothetical protein
MQQILVDVIALVAVLFLVRLLYRSFTASRRSKQAACNGCGTCDAARKDVPAKGGVLLPTDGHR